MTESNPIEGYDALADIRQSLGLVVNYSKTSSQKKVQEPFYPYDVLKELYFKDPIISSAVDLKAETILANGWRFRGKNSRDIEKAYREFDRLNMYEVLLNFIKQCEAYGDGYLEPTFEGDKVSEVHTLETPITRIMYNKNGVIEGYVQVNSYVLAPAQDKQPDWEADEILHFSYSKFGSNVYSYAPHVSIAYNTVNTRMLGNHYILQIFKNLPPHMVHILKNSSAKQMVHYKQVVQGVKSNMNQPLVVRSPKGVDTGVDIKQFVVDFTKGGLLDVLHYFREEILTRMRVPPTLLGLNASEGRAEPQMYLFITHIRSLQMRFAKFLNMELLPKMGLNCELYFPPAILGDEEVILRIARSMIDSGMTGEGDNHPALVFLREKGFNIPEGTKIEDPKQKDIETMPSRTRKGMKQGKEQKDNKDKFVGDSEESKGKIEKGSIRSAYNEVLDKE